MKFYIDKQEKYTPGSKPAFTYQPIDFDKAVNEDNFWYYISRNLMIVLDNGSVYYSFLLQSNPTFDKMNKENSKEQIEDFLPVNLDVLQQGYCEVSEAFVFGFLSHLNKGLNSANTKNRYTKIIGKLSELVNKEKQKKEYTWL